MIGIPVEKIEKKIVYDSWANDSYNIKNAKNNNLEMNKSNINFDDYDSDSEIDDKNGQNHRNNKSNDNNNNNSNNNDKNIKNDNKNNNINLSPERGTFSLTSMENIPASPISPRASDVIPNNRNYLSQKNREGKENQNKQDFSSNMQNKNENESENENENEKRSRFSDVDKNIVKSIFDSENKDDDPNMKNAENDENKQKLDLLENKNNLDNVKGSSATAKKGANGMCSHTYSSKNPILNFF